MEEKIYIIGHKSPDLDSVAAAIAYAYFKNQAEATDKYEPRVLGEINRETDFVLEKFGFEKPETLDNAQGKKVLLVDHNEFSQSADGIEEADIVEVLDHHKVDFKYSEPICFRACPWGATCSIVASMAMRKGVEISKELAGLMLSAILVDTVIYKSPTATEYDKEIMDKLCETAGIDNWQDFGMELFKVRSSVSDLNAKEIIKSDFKDFNFKQAKFGIGQVETADLGELGSRKQEILNKLEEMRNEAGYHSVVLFVTDIIKEGSLFLVSSEDLEEIEKSLGSKLENKAVFLDGIISRKKQVVPMFSEVFDK